MFDISIFELTIKAFFDNSFLYLIFGSYCGILVLSIL